MEQLNLWGGLNGLSELSYRCDIKQLTQQKGVMGAEDTKVAIELIIWDS